MPVKLPALPHGVSLILLPLTLSRQWRGKFRILHLLTGRFARAVLWRKDLTMDLSGSGLTLM
jgi:hypothetical protein